MGFDCFCLWSECLENGLSLSIHLFLNHIVRCCCHVSLQTAVYRFVVDDVITNVRRDFEDMGVDETIMHELQRVSAGVD